MTNPDLALALERFRLQQGAYQLFNDYYSGRHRLAYMSDKFRSAFGLLFASYAKNFCARVVDAPVERLRITGFGVTDESPPARRQRQARQRVRGAHPAASDVGDNAWALWQTSRMALVAAAVHTEALLSGDSYLQVWPDRDGLPRAYVNPATQMTVFYDPDLPGVIQWAAKCWAGYDNRVRLTLYYPDRIEKWVTAKPIKGWMEPLPTRVAGTVPGADPRLAADSVRGGQLRPTSALKAGQFIEYRPEGEEWPLRHSFGHPTVFHFANRARLDGFGVSELAAIIPVQDELNKAVLDLLVAMEYAALPQRYIVGWEPEIDQATGKPRNTFSAEAGALWYFGGDNTGISAGQYPAADMAAFLVVQDTAKADIARLSATPLHHLMLQSGEFPSGESMKTAEAPFVAKIEAAQTVFGPVWEAVVAFMLRIGREPVTDAHLTADWFDPEPRSEKAHAETLAIKRGALQVPRRQIWREADYSETEIEDMEADLEEERAATPPPVVVNNLPPGTNSATPPVANGATPPGTGNTPAASGAAPELVATKQTGG